MTSRTTTVSPQVYARAAGLLFLTVIVAGIIAQMVISGRIVVDGDATTTATNILAQPLGNQLFLYILLIGLLGGVTQILWLLIKGVNVEKWNAMNFLQGSAT